MNENRQAIIEMISRTKDHKRMNVLIKHYIHLFHPKTLLTNVLVNLVNDIIENERKEDNKMENLRNNDISDLLRYLGKEVKIEYNEDDLIFKVKTLFLMNGLANKDTQNTNLNEVLKSINDKLSNEIKVSGIEENKSLVGDIKAFIILSIYRVTIYDYIKFSLEKNSAESNQILNILDMEDNNEWKGARLSD